MPEWGASFVFFLLVGLMGVRGEELRICAEFRRDLKPCGCPFYGACGLEVLRDLTIRDWIFLIKDYPEMNSLVL